jgi:hypothetical protein
MAKTSYLRFNPDTREIEIEGSEKFVKAYFDKLQQMLPKLSGEGKKESVAAKTLPVKKARAKTTVKAETQTPKKNLKVANKKAGAKESKKAPLTDKVMGLIQDSAKGITTSELKDKTGLTARQIWGVTNQAVKLGKIRTTKRGVYVPV